MNTELLGTQTISLKANMDQVAELVLAAFQRNKHVRHKQSIAVIIADVVRGELIVEFKQRVAMKDGEKRRVTTGKKMNASKYGVQRQVFRYSIALQASNALDRVGDCEVSNKTTHDQQLCSKCVLL